MKGPGLKQSCIRSYIGHHVIKNVMVLSPVRLGVDGFIYETFAWACPGRVCSGLGSPIPWAGLGRVWICSRLVGPGWAGFKFTSTSNLANGPGFAGLARVGLH